MVMIMLLLSCHGLTSLVRISACNIEKHGRPGYEARSDMIIVIIMKIKMCIIIIVMD